MNKKTNKNQIMSKALELMPWYAINKLSPDDLKFMDEAIADYPELLQAIESEKESISIVKSNPSVLNLSALEAPEDRVDSVLNLINSQQSTPQETEIEQEVTPEISWLKRLVNNLFPSNLQSGNYAYASYAFVILTAVVALFTYKQFQSEESVFYPASKETVTSSSNNISDATVLLVGVNGKLDSPKLLELLQEVDADISSVPDKAGLYKVTLGKKIDSKAVNALIDKLRAEEELIWFAGKSNNKSK